MEYDYIKCGDCLELMKDLPSESINCIITSPPYYKLRDYNHINQIGLENTVDEYIEKLCDVFKEIYRILKKDGSFWLNISDVYFKKSLLCIPDKIKVKLVEMGFKCKNEIIWHKPNAMPSSIKNRFNNDYEKLYFFTKSDDYYFKTQYEPMKSVVAKNTHTANSKSKTKYENIEQESSVRQGMNKSRGNKLIEVRRNLPNQDEFVSFMRSRTTVNNICENSKLKKSKVEHWFRKDKCGFAYPSVNDWNEIKYLVDDFSQEFTKIDFGLTEIDYETDDILKNANRGRIKRAVWHINTKAFKGKHYAAFPLELVDIPIVATCPPGGIVLDPFLGSGTTAVASIKNNRHYIGFEINPEYVEIAKNRIKDAI